MIGVGIVDGRLAAVGKSPILAGDLAAWLADGGPESLSRWLDADPESPAEGIWGLEALGLALWLSDRTGREYRLALEAEWSLAASSGEDCAWKSALAGSERRESHRGFDLSRLSSEFGFGGEPKGREGNALGFLGFGEAWELTGSEPERALPEREPRLIARGGGRIDARGQRGRLEVGALERVSGLRARLACEAEGAERERSEALRWAEGRLAGKAPWR